MAEETVGTVPAATCFVCGGRLSHERHELEDDHQIWQYCADCFQLLHEVALEPQRVS